MSRIDLTQLELPEGWTRRSLGAGRVVVEALDAAAELVVPLTGVGLHDLRLGLLTYANRRCSSMRWRLTSQKVWRRVRPMRFIYDDFDAIQAADLLALPVRPGDALHIRTEARNGIAIAEMTLSPADAFTPPRSEKRVALVQDSAMSLSTYTLETPDDFDAILQPAAGSHVTDVCFGTGVGTYRPLYESRMFGWHGRERAEQSSAHRERAADVMRLLMAAGRDPLAMAVDFAHKHSLRLWANHRISKNHDSDFRDDYRGGRFLIEHRDKRVCEASGKPHPQCILSHAYPEVRSATVQCLVEQARYGVDGLYIDFLRKSPIAGWETRSVEDFIDTHGFDPRGTRPDDFKTRWIDHLCTYATGLLRELRESLRTVERELGRRVPVAVNVRGGWHFGEGRPACAIEGLDPCTWAREGLVDVIIPGHDLWLRPCSLDRYLHDLADTGCTVWGAIGPQDHVLHRSTAERRLFASDGGGDHADLDPWRYLQAAHDFYSQGASGVALWEAHDMPSVPQVWNAIQHRIGSFTELCSLFGDKLGRYDGSDKVERERVDSLSGGNCGSY